MKPKNIISYILCILLSVCFMGCSIFAPKTQMIGLYSTPEGARVSVDGKYVGVTPTSYHVSRGDDHIVEFSKTGYQTVFRTARSTLSNMGMVDVIGGACILLPFIGLASDGAYKMEPGAFAVTLEPIVAPRQIPVAPVE